MLCLPNCGRNGTVARQTSFTSCGTIRPFGDVGIPAIQQVRGLRTPNLNAMAREGILFTRMYTEVGCTPSRAACITGRYAVRSGMYNIGMLGESHGIPSYSRRGDSSNS